jgi:hypothetical protein
MLINGLNIYGNICLYGFFLFSLIWILVWLVWIRNYLRLHGERPAFCLSRMAPHIDYTKANQIAEKEGLTPWFIRWGKRAGYGGLLLLFMFIITMLLAHGLGEWGNTGGIGGNGGIRGHQGE